MMVEELVTVRFLYGALEVFGGGTVLPEGVNVVVPLAGVGQRKAEHMLTVPLFWTNSPISFLR
jgi:hypothetical protein